MTSRWGAAAVLVAGAVVTSAAGYAAWSAPQLQAPQPRQAEAAVVASPDLQRAETRARARARAASADWVDREITAREGAGDPLRLVGLYERSPEAFAGHEAASLRVANALLRLERLRGYAGRLRQQWSGGDERHKAGWLLFDADVLLDEGQREKALDLVKTDSKSVQALRFAGRDEARRLAREALLVGPRDEAGAWALLGRAGREAPGDPDVLSLRARLLEELGRAGEARAAYEAAARAAPGDVFLRDQLGEFHRRSGDYAAALAAWLPEGDAPPDFLWLKGWFWARVARPVAFDWAQAAPAEGIAHVTAGYLLGLPPDAAFWGDDSIQVRALALAQGWNQELFWLRLLGALQGAGERQAADLLQEGSFRGRSWDPELENALARVLAYRRGETPPGDPVPAGPAARRRVPPHPFFAQLEELARRKALAPGSPAVPADLARLLGGEEALAATFLAAGWAEAARQLHRRGADLARLPPWVAAEMGPVLQSAPERPPRRLNPWFWRRRMMREVD